MREETRLLSMSTSDVRAMVRRDREAIVRPGAGMWIDPPTPALLELREGTKDWVWLVFQLDALAVFFDEVEDEYGVSEVAADGCLVGMSLFGELQWAVAAIRTGSFKAQRGDRESRG